MQKKVIVHPEKAGLVYHIRPVSDSQSRVQDHMYEVSMELIRLLEKVHELEETFCKDLNLFLWLYVSSERALVCHI